MEYPRYIIPKKSTRKKNLDILEYGISSNIKKKITTHGGVKFNQAKKCLSAIAYMNAHISS